MTSEHWWPLQPPSSSPRAGLCMTHGRRARAVYEGLEKIGETRKKKRKKRKKKRKKGDNHEDSLKVLNKVDIFSLCSALKLPPACFSSKASPPPLPRFLKYHGGKRQRLKRASKNLTDCLRPFASGRSCPSLLLSPFCKPCGNWSSVFCFRLRRRKNFLQIWGCIMISSLINIKWHICTSAAHL